MGYYSAQNTAILAILNAITGIGMCYASPQDVTNEANFKTRFVKNNVINTCWISRQNGSDDEHAKFGSVDEADVITHTQADDYWVIIFLYGYKENVSEPIFQLLVDSIQDSFRFIQNLGGDMYESSRPLQRPVCGIFQFLGGYMCHKAEFRLQITERIVDLS
jgi:hypothetical protein